MTGVVGDLRQLWGLLAVDRRRLALAVLLGTLALVCGVGLTASAAWLIARAAEQPPILELSVAVVAVRALGIGRAVFRYADRLISHDIALRGLVELRVSLYERLARLSTDRLLGLQRGELLLRIGLGTDALADVVVRVLLPTLAGLVAAAAAVIVVAWIMPAAGALLAAMLLLAVLGGCLLSVRAAWCNECDAATARTAISNEVQAIVDSADELRLAGRLPDRMAALARWDGQLRECADRGAAASAGSALTVLAAQALATVGSLMLGSAALAGGGLDSVQLTVVVLTSLVAFDAVTGLPGAAVAALRCRLAARDVLALMNLADDEGPPRSGPAGNPRTAESAGEGLSACDLTVGHAGNQSLLSGINLDIRPGTRLRVHGPSGSGKTTLLLTLAGLHPPAGGTLTLHGRPIGDWEPSELRRHVCYLAENAHIFATTVRENLRIAAGPHALDSTLVDMLGSVGLTDWLLGTPAGLDTTLTSGGGTMSGGERRRLLVARTLLSGADILLLDEPTEHLDTAAADALLHDLWSLDPRLSVIIATHTVRGEEHVDDLDTTPRTSTSTRENPVLVTRAGGSS